jgi:hypothetical protein
MVDGVITYLRPMAVRSRYHANDISRDVLDRDPHTVAIADIRTATDTPRLDREGFALVSHVSAVADFADAGALYRDEIIALISDLSGADAVVVNSPGILRFSEQSAQSGMLNNSRPARFAHVDVSDATAAAFAERAKPQGRTMRRFAHYNIWRCVSAPPQDVPLTLCDARSVGPQDLFEADAIFDEPGKPEWSFIGLVLAHNKAHRWHYTSQMTPDEVLVFKTNDSDPAQPHAVPHVAFNDPSCPPDTHPRRSIEMRATAYWFD